MAYGTFIRGIPGLRGMLVLLLTGCGGAAESETLPSLVSPATVASGLDDRSASPPCPADYRTAAHGVRYVLQRVFPSLTFRFPVAMLQAPGEAGKWYVVERAGVVRVFDNVDSVSASRVFIDIRRRVDTTFEGGLLAMAFHPDYPQTPHVYLYYTATRGPNALESRLSRFRLGPNGVLEPASERMILRFPQPFNNHNGGEIKFGADGYLYIGFGDGGSGGDPQDHGQNTRTLLGSMLRIDVDRNTGAAPYAIPVDNPFRGNGLCTRGAGNAPCPEIFAWGLRNPWRWSFDRVTGDLWLGDVGQNAWEEIDIIRRGRNYGWKRCEGGYVFPETTPPTACDDAALTNPILSYGRSDARSIVGGYVYRGRHNRGLVGKYVHGDYVTRNIWALDYYANPAASPQWLLRSPVPFVTFAEAKDGELYVPAFHGANGAPGGLYRLVETSAGAGAKPARLSATGCGDPPEPKTPTRGRISAAVDVTSRPAEAMQKRPFAPPTGSTT